MDIDQWCVMCDAAVAAGKPKPPLQRFIAANRTYLKLGNKWGVDCVYQSMVQAFARNWWLRVQHARGRTPDAAPPAGRGLNTVIQKNNEK